jgi:hypothetical protein
MSCDATRAMFSELADDALPAEQRVACQAHLAACADCRREWEGLQRTLRLLHGMPRVRAPQGIVERVLAAVRPDPWPRRLARRLFVPLFIKLPLEAAALILVTVGGVWLVQRTPEMQQVVQREAPAVADARQPAPPPAAPQRPASGAPAARVERAPAEPREARPERTGFDKSTQAPPQIAPRAPEAPKAAAHAYIKSPETETPRQAPRVARVLTPARVTGRLTVDDREMGERTLAGLSRRLGALTLSRAEQPDGSLVIEVRLPHAAYAEFSRELATIGTWTPEAEVAESAVPVEVRIVLRSVR